MITRAAYPLDEAQALLGNVSRAFLYKMAARGEIRLVRLGRRVLVPADEIRRLVGSNAPSNDNDPLNS